MIDEDQKHFLKTYKALIDQKGFENVTLSQVRIAADIPIPVFSSWRLPESPNNPHKPFWDEVASLKPASPETSASSEDIFTIPQAPRLRPVARPARSVVPPSPHVQTRQEAAPPLSAEEQRNLWLAEQQRERSTTSRLAAALGKPNRSPAEQGSAAAKVNSGSRPPARKPALERKRAVSAGEGRSYVSHVTAGGTAEEVAYDGPKGAEFRQALRQNRGDFDKALADSGVSPEQLIQWVNQGSGTREAIEATAVQSGNSRPSQAINAIGARLVKKQIDALSL